MTKEWQQWHVEMDKAMLENAKRKAAMEKQIKETKHGLRPSAIQAIYDGPLIDPVNHAFKKEE